MPTLQLLGHFLLECHISVIPPDLDVICEFDYWQRYLAVSSALLVSFSLCAPIIIGLAALARFVVNPIMSCP